MKQYPSQARLRELFDYDPEGFLVWRVTNSKRALAGSIAGSRGYNSGLRYVFDIGISGNVYKGARLIWIWHRGDIPERMKITTKNSIHPDTRIENLEAVIRAKTHLAPSIDGTSCYKGVYKRDGGSWRVELGGKDLGTYSLEIAAARAYDIASEKKHGAGFFIGNDIDHEVNPEDYRLTLCGNISNSKRSRGLQSSYIGVSEHIRKKSGIRYSVKCRKKHIGIFDTEEQAARAYNIAARAHYGEHAILNDIPDPLGNGDVF